MTDPPRYRDYLTGGGSSGGRRRVESDVDAAESVVVMKMQDGSWHAVWQGETLLGEFDGTRLEAVEWARQRCDRVLVYAEELGDLVLDDGENS